MFSGCFYNWSGLTSATFYSMKAKTMWVYVSRISSHTCHQREWWRKWNNRFLRVDSCYFSGEVSFAGGSFSALRHVTLVGLTITRPCCPLTGVVICPQTLSGCSKHPFAWITWFIPGSTWPGRASQSHVERELRMLRVKGWSCFFWTPWYVLGVIGGHLTVTWRQSA